MCVYVCVCVCVCVDEERKREMERGSEDSEENITPLDERMTSVCLSFPFAADRLSADSALCAATDAANGSCAGHTYTYTHRHTHSHTNAHIHNTAEEQRGVLRIEISVSLSVSFRHTHTHTHTHSLSHAVSRIRPFQFHGTFVGGGIGAWGARRGRSGSKV